MPARVWVQVQQNDLKPMSKRVKRQQRAADAKEADDIDNPRGNPE